MTCSGRSRRTLAAAGCGWLAVIGCRSRELGLDACGHGRDLLGAKPRGGRWRSWRLGGPERECANHEDHCCCDCEPFDVLHGEPPVRYLFCLLSGAIEPSMARAMGAFFVPEITPDSVPERTIMASPRPCHGNTLCLPACVYCWQPVLLAASAEVALWSWGQAWRAWNGRHSVLWLLAQAATQGARPDTEELARRAGCSLGAIRKLESRQTAAIALRWPSASPLSWSWRTRSGSRF